MSSSSSFSSVILSHSSSSFSSSSSSTSTSSFSSSSYVIAIQDILVSGFGDTNVNGTYTYTKYLDGHAQYTKGNYTIIYHASYMPISDGPAYYIIYNSHIPGAINIEVPKYINYGSNITGGTWYGIRDFTSLENNTTSASIVHV